ncbi:MAG: EamA family transporter [Actinomycetales bacterium]|nr:EamA family transporter [Actinomycetales bacterium]
MISARLGVACILGGSTFFATIGTAQAIAGLDASPLALGGARLIVASIALILLLPAFGQPRLGLARMWRGRAMIIAALATAGFQVSFFAGVRQAGVALGTLIVIGSVPIFTGLLSWAFLRQRPTLGWLAATAVCLAGLALLFWQGLAAGSPVGVLLCLVTGLGIATYAVAARTMLDTGMHPVRLMAGTFSLGAVIMLPIVLVQPLGWLTQPHGIALALYLGLATMVLANWLQLQGLTVIGPAPTMTLNLAEPLIATVLGVVVLGEHLSPLGVEGLMLVMAGLTLQSVLLARQENRQPAATTAA